MTQCMFVCALFVSIQPLGLGLKVHTVPLLLDLSAYT
jgi:hypothetical protein